MCRRVSIIRWIQRDDVKVVITRIAEYLERDLLRLESCGKIPWGASNIPFRVIELMPTFEGQTYFGKYVNGHPSSPARGYQTRSAFVALADVDNGYPTFLVEMTLLTALRTAATSVMVAKHLARPDSTTMAMIGTGSQGEFQALGFHGLLGIKTLRVYDIDPKAMDKLERNLKPLGFQITVCDSVDEAVEGADIITTCTADKAQNTILHDAQVRPGVHLNAVGGDCPGKTELDPAILDRSTVFVEFPPQTRIEGEIQQKPDDFPVVEFWQVLTGAVPGRRTAKEITLFGSVGFAIADGSALKYLRDMTAGSDLQTEIDLVAEPEDPKALFSLVTVLSPIS
ncbi:ornithine cyclodeaminase [Rothia kristinae]|uniref:ornithine cyclodeaminase n=1 Tax=Rothia kristinae TaxID=37923 RepID=UPI0021B644DA|nr:ornithine cyclodeaminase [Rothia kristinae]